MHTHRTQMILLNPATDLESLRAALISVSSALSQTPV